MKKILLSVFVTLLCFSSAFALELPSGFTSIYDLNLETERCPVKVAAAANLQLTGPGANWDKVELYDLSNYKQMAIKLSFPAANGGNQMCLRFASNLKVNSPVLINLPSGVTEYVVTVPLESYKDAEGHLGLGGLLVYNGATHWTITYTGTPSNQDVTVQYIAVSEAAPVTAGVTTTKAENPDALVNVHSIAGELVRKGVKLSESTNGLQPGLYIINGKKVCVLK